VQARKLAQRGDIPPKAGLHVCPIPHTRKQSRLGFALYLSVTRMVGQTVGNCPMNSFLSLVTNPFGNARDFAPESLLPRRPVLVTKDGVYNAPAVAMPDPRRWSIWASGYGGENKTAGDPVLVGSHDRSARTYGYAAGLDYRATPYTVVGFALGGGGTNFSVADGFGGGHSEMFQSAVYSITRVDAAYVSTALDYAWHHVSTSRDLTVAATDTINAQFSTNNVAGRIEGGYRFAIPGVFGLTEFGFTPYAAWQMQAFHTPSYNETSAAGSPFALSYNANTITTNRTELGAWFDRTTALYNGAILALRTRTA
jgi:uncharacterized protein with beta-barrel porin domain